MAFVTLNAIPTLVEKMEVIVLHRHLQMITSPHHQGTSHLQAKEVTKNTPNYQGGNTKKKSQHHQGKKYIAKIED
jgi:hypothetical protein